MPTVRQDSLFSPLPESARLLRKNGLAETPQGAFPEEDWRFVRGKRADVGQRSCKKIRFLQLVISKKGVKMVAQYFYACYDLF